MNRSEFTLKNLLRNPFRKLAIVFSVALAAAALLSVMTIIKAVEDDMNKSIGRLGADIMVVPAGTESTVMNALLGGEPSELYMDRSLEKDISEIEGVKSVASQVYLRTIRLGCCTVGDVLVTAFDPKSDFTIIPWLEVGDEMDRPFKYNDAVIGDELFALILEARKNPNDNKRSFVALFGMRFTIVSILDDTGIKSMDNTVFITYEALKDIVDKSDERGLNLDDIKGLADKASAILVRIEPDADPGRIAALIEHYLPDAKAIKMNEVPSSVSKQLTILLNSISVVNVILWVIALILAGLIFYLIIKERKKEN